MALQPVSKKQPEPAATPETLKVEAPVAPEPPKRPSIEEVVEKWHQETVASAPARHHRDRGEWIEEHLPLLVVALKEREV